MVQRTAKEIEGKDIQIVVCKVGLANEYTASNDRLLGEIGEIRLTEHAESIRQLYNDFLERKESIDIMALLYQG